MISPGGRRFGGLERAVPIATTGRPRIILVAGLALQLALGLALLSMVG
ncbi:MAG TPA: hypothetical protein VFG23_15650 [Polyangia bacterium]|nr:hypothetical protein [Polyangia bacterium]